MLEQYESNQLRASKPVGEELVMSGLGEEAASDQSSMQFDNSQNMRQSEIQPRIIEVHERLFRLSFQGILTR